jgi:protein-tyrosine phosphatase
MVCYGNICRSPLAEGLLRFKVDSTQVLVDSAGTAKYHVGEPPCKNSIRVAQENLLDISTQRARLFQLSDFDKFDIIYAMDQLNSDKLMELAPNEEAKKKVNIILNEVFPGENMDVPDPYNSSYFAFRNVYRMLDEACSVIASKLV